jgi:signal transduction histidine kinase
MRQLDIHSPGLSCRHVVQYYDSPELLAESVARFLAEGFELGQAGVIICGLQRSELVERCLMRDGWPVRDKAGSIDLRVFDNVDVLEQLMPSGMFDESRIETTLGKLIWPSSRAGRRAVRLYGELAPLLLERGQFEDALRLEQLADTFSQRHDLPIFCGYRMSQFAHDGLAYQFGSICDAHDTVLPSEELMTCDQRRQLRRVADLERQAARQERILAELQQALKKQAEADRHKDEFLAMLGHELRNPLAPIFTALELMSLRGDRTSTRERDVIRRQANHLTHLVDDLLDVSRVARGKIKLEKVPVEIADLLARAVEMASPVFEERGHHLTISVQRQGLVVDADVVRLSQVLANLLGNAAKYTDPGGRVSVVAHRAGSEIVVEVTDNGNGIAPELLPMIFDVFVQGDQEIDRAKGGLGLGLALAKNLTHLHGGSVSAHSDGPGQGSTFVLRLPASHANASATQAPRPTPSEKLRAATVPVHKVLLVDDNEDAADVLAEVLRMRGCEVTVAHDGLEALGFAKEARHDIALVDLGLPVMDGYELADRLRETLGLEAPKLIAVTGYGQESDRARTHQAGFVAHLVKPVGLEELLDTISKA